MEILKFALGMRFDFLKDRFDERDVSFILGEISQVLSASDVEGLHMYGGLARVGERDSDGVFTVVFQNGKMKPMRAVYNKLNNDAVLRSFADHNLPYVQNNVIRSFEGLDFYGVIGQDGSLSGGIGGFSFKPASKPRKAFSEEGSIVIAPNSYKGTIPAVKAVRLIMKALRERMPDRNLVFLPVADGGDGTLDAVESSMLGVRRRVQVTAPYGNKVNAEYLIVDGKRAVIESALASGLALCSGRELDPDHASSFGTGELILRALHEGIREIYVCLGGSATNDCGIGLARALGVRFIKFDGEEAQFASEMKDIVKIDTSSFDPLLKTARICAVCDVKNPLTGRDGATFTFGPQKGAKGETLSELEQGMRNMETLLDALAGKPVCSLPGAGAAGGMGAVLMAVFGADKADGAETVLSVEEIDEKLKHASLIITGEGRIDASTLNGKAVGAVMDHAERAKVPVALLAGSLGNGAEAVLKRSSLYEISGSETDAERYFEEACKRLADRIAKL